jgi:hypothetical protein
MFGLASIFAPCVGAFICSSFYISQNSDGPLASDRGLGFSLSFLPMIGLSFLVGIVLPVIALARREKHWWLALIGLLLDTWPIFYFALSR